MQLKPEAFGPCIQKIVDRAKVSGTEAAAMMQRVAENAYRLRELGDPDPFGNAARQLANDLKKGAVKGRLDALRNTAIRRSVMNRIEANGGARMAMLTILSHMVHINQKLPAMAAPAEEGAAGMAFRWLTGIHYGLDRLGALGEFARGHMDDDIARKLYELSQIGPHRPPDAGDVAGQAAWVLHAVLHDAGERLKGAGGRFDHALDYITHTSHDPHLMRAAGFEQWWADTEPRLAERTFETVAPRRNEDGALVETEADARKRFGFSVYQALRTGVHMTPSHGDALSSEDAYIPPAFEGTHNLAQKISHQRVLYWKDADSWMAHMRQYGGMITLGDAIMKNLSNAARVTALMERFGTNPMGSLNMLIRAVEERYRDTHTEDVERFQKDANYLRNIMGRLDGSLNIPANEGGAEWLQMFRNLENATLLGNVGLTHLMSLPATMGSIGKHYGVGFLDVFQQNLDALRRGAAPGEAATILQEAGAFNHGTLAHMFTTFNLAPGAGFWSKVPGRTAALAAISLKFSGLNYILENSQNGFRMLLMHAMGRDIDRDFTGLDLLRRNNLAKYGIGQREWELLQTVRDGMHVWEERRYATPADFKRLSNEHLDEYNRDAIKALHDQVAQLRQKHRIADALEEDRRLNREENLDSKIAEWKTAAERRIAERDEHSDALRDWFNDQLLAMQARQKALRAKGAELRRLATLGTKEEVRNYLEMLRQSVQAERAKAMAAGVDEPGKKALRQADKETRGTINEDFRATRRNQGEAVTAGMGEMRETAQEYARKVIRANEDIARFNKAAQERLDALTMQNVKDKTSIIQRAMKLSAEMRILDANAEARIWSRAEQLEAEEQRLPDEIERLRKETRWRLADSYAAFLAHAGREATVAAGARERAWALGGSRPGTIDGELRRMFAQFKMWPLAVIAQVHGREWFAEQSKGARNFSVGQIVALSMLGGAMRMAIRDALVGDPQRDWSNPKTILGAVAQGGGVGIYGDFLFGEVNRMGGGFLTTLAGPVVGDAARGVNIFYKFRDDTYNVGDPTVHRGRGLYADIWPELARYIVHHFPLVNLIGVKGALDYLIWHHMYEALNPGYWERMNRRKLKETGRAMLGYIPGAGVPTYPGGLGGKYGFIGNSR